MNDQLALLVRAQELDNRIARLAEQKQAIPARREEASGPLREARAVLERLRAEIEAKNRERKDREQDLAAHEARIEKQKARSAEIKTNKEYQAHLAEIETARQEQGRLEEELLICLEQIDTLRRQATEQQQAVSREEQRSAEQERQLEAQEQAVNAELARLESKSEATIARLEDQWRKEYYRLKSTRKGMAVVPIRNGTCAGCRLSLPPQLVAEVRRLGKILTCSHCYRILYWPEEVAVTETEGSKANRA